MSKSNIDRRLDKISRILDPKNLSARAHKHFVSITPIDTGNARRSTVLENTDIVAAYPYARLLDQGYSKQAPDGMSQPTVDYIRDYIQQQTGIKLK